MHHAHAHTIRLRPTPYYTHMHMHMRLQYGTPYYMHMHMHTCARNTIPLTMAFPSLHTNHLWEHNYMDLAHNTARLVCCEYKEGEYNTCIGAACTSSIELTCSCTCGRMPIAHGHAYASDIVHAHTTIRFLIGISRIAYRLHGTWACTRPSLAHNPRGWCVCI